MASREPMGSGMIAVPVIVCMAWAMAGESIEVRRGYTPSPRSAEAERMSPAPAHRQALDADVLHLASIESSRFASLHGGPFRGFPQLPPDNWMMPMGPGVARE